MALFIVYQRILTGEVQSAGQPRSAKHSWLDDSSGYMGTIQSTSVYKFAIHCFIMFHCSPARWGLLDSMASSPVLCCPPGQKIPEGCARLYYMSEYDQTQVLQDIIRRCARENVSNSCLINVRPEVSIHDRNTVRIHVRRNVRSNVQFTKECPHIWQIKCPNRCQTKHQCLCQTKNE